MKGDILEIEEYEDFEVVSIDTDTEDDDLDIYFYNDGKINIDVELKGSRKSWEDCGASFDITQEAFDKIIALRNKWR